MTDLNTATRMADAAQAWLDSLDDTQRKAAGLPWPSDEERHRWYYTPTDHGGLPLAAMRPAQQQLAMRLVATGLSRPGYVTVSTIIGLENTLDEIEGWRFDWGRERGRDPQLYWLRVFGDPGTGNSGNGEPWSWRFGGHHVSVHHVIVDGQVQASTPCFLGANPAQSPLLGGHLLRPLGAAEDLARDLVRSLDDEQAARALLSAVAPGDIVGANRPRVSDGDLPLTLPQIFRGQVTGSRPAHQAGSAQPGTGPAAGTGPVHNEPVHNEPGHNEPGHNEPGHNEAVRLTALSAGVPKGLPAAAMSPAQHGQLRALLHVFLDRIPDDLAEREAAKFAGDKLHGVYFGWAGGIEPGQPHYYRLQGPRLLAEYDNTQDDVNHIHTVWRDPEGDFGDDVLARHLAAFHSPR